MSFLTDLFHGNFGNLGHDISADPLGSAGVALGGTALALAAMQPELLPAIWGGLGAEAGAGAGGAGLFGGLSGLFGGTEAAAAGGDVLAGATAADLALPEAATATAGTSDIASMFGLGSTGAGTEAAAGAAAPATGGGLISGLGDITGAGVGGAAEGAGGSSFLGSLGAGALKSLTSNPLGIAASGIGLGMNLLRGQQVDPNQAILSQQASQLGAQGAALQQYLTTGTLPPAMKAQLDQATAAEKARIIANHARNGMSTDPSQNSALAQELNSVDTNAVAAMAQAQIQMMTTGLNATGLSSQLYEMLTKMDRQDNQDLMTAISNFASALGGAGGKGQTLQLKLAA